MTQNIQQKQPRRFLKVWNILQWPSQSPDLNPIEHAFHLLKTKLKAERHTNKQQLKSAAVKTWQSITKEETQSLVMSMSSRLKAVIACKGVAESVPLAPYSGHQREPSPSIRFHYISHLSPVPASFWCLTAKSCFAPVNISKRF